MFYLLIRIAAWILGAFASALLWRYLKWRFSPLHKRIPGPRQNFTLRDWLVGVFAAVEQEGFMKPHRRWLKEVGGDPPMLHYTGILGKHFICILDADGVKQILTSRDIQQPRFVKGLYYLKRVIGDGLVTLDGSTWQLHRRIIQPSFNNQALKEALDSAIPDMMDRLISAWKEREGSDIDLASHCSALTLDIIGKVGFEHDFKSLESLEEWGKDKSESCEVELNDPLIKGLYNSLMPSLVRMLLVNLRLVRFERFLIPESYKTQVILNEAVEAVVERAHTRYKNRDASSTKPKCLLELLFEAKDTEPGSRGRSLSHKEMEEETKTFLVAGHETTSTLCVWAIYCLIQHPDKQKLVLDDIMKYAPKEGQIKLEHVEKMSYLEAFLKEVLRLWPPIGMIVRNTNGWVNILGEQIPPQTRITIPIFLLHRSPKYWTDPLSFKPERWLKENGTDEKFHHFAYFPFSAGSRNCIGSRFAMWEAKLILAPIIREFEMSISPKLDGVDLKLVSFITIKSIPPVLIHAKARK